MKIIPLFSDRSYDYTILLNEVYWRLTFLYNPRASQWTISIEYDDTQEILISGIAMPAGVDILHQYRPEGNRFGKLLPWNDDDPTQDMNFENVDQFTLYYFLPDEDIPDSFNLVYPSETQRNAIVEKITYSSFPS